MQKKLKTQTTVIDGNGEIIETVKIFNIKVDTPEQFYMTYLNTMGGYFKLTAALDYKLLAKMCCHAKFNTGEVSISSKLRKIWATELETSNQNISNSLKRLKETKIISGSEGEFLINPVIFWKGDSEERKKLMKSNSIRVTFELQ